MEPVVAPRTFSGRYEVTHLIARGGMAQVYRALDTRLGRHVALKVLFPELSVDRTFVERFRREAQAAANLSHPSIVAVYDWGEDEGNHFIVMELITGTSLATALRAERTLPATRAAQIAAEVASALAYAHRHGVVHRDIKPGNVLLTDEGQVKVTDFGIAQAVSTEEGLTMAGSVMGTAAYFSPEQAEGAVVDGRSDLYSLGVVLFEMLAGRPPFVGDSPVAVASMHVRNAPPQLRDLAPAVPESLDLVTMHALEKAPADRYQSAEEMRADLLRFTEGQPVLAAAGAATGTAAVVGATSVMGAAATSTLPARDTTLVVPAVAGAAVAGAAVATAPPGVAPPEDAGPPSDEVMPRPSSSRNTWIVVGLVLALLVVGALVWRSLSGASTIAVPQLRGVQYDQAISTLSSEGLKWTKATQPSSDVNFPAGTVISTSPPAGHSVAPGSTVHLLVSSGKPQMELVPYVVGTQLSNAIAQLHAVKLNYTLVYVAKWQKPVLPGSVVAQDTASGTLVPSGSSVKLTLLQSNGQFGLPNVVGVPQLTATTTLAQYGLTVGSTSSACSPSAPNGYVAQTSPVAGALVTNGTAIALVISNGACPVPVPDVLGETVSVAESTLTSASLQPNPETTCQQGFTSTGKIAYQNPSPPTKVKPGSIVTIRVGCVAGPSGSTGPPGAPQLNVKTHGHGHGHGHGQGAVLAFVSRATRRSS